MRAAECDDAPEWRLTISLQARTRRNARKPQNDARGSPPPSRCYESSTPSRWMLESHLLENEALGTDQTLELRPNMLPSVSTHRVTQPNSPIENFGRTI
jgi:hypothetical protein